MKTIREMAQECAKEFDPEYNGAEIDDESVRFFERFIEKYLSQQEPVAWMIKRKSGAYGECGSDHPFKVPVFLAPPIPAGMKS